MLSVQQAEKIIANAHNTKPIAMSAIGHTTDFPREDNIFKHKESLPYDES